MTYEEALDETVTYEQAKAEIAKSFLTIEEFMTDHPEWCGEASTVMEWLGY